MYSHSWVTYKYSLAMSDFFIKKYNDIQYISLKIKYVKKCRRKKTCYVTKLFKEQLLKKKCNSRLMY